MLRWSDYPRGAGDISAITIPYLNSQFGEIIKVSVLKYFILDCFPLFNRAMREGCMIKGRIVYVCTRWHKTIMHS